MKRRVFFKRVAAVMIGACSLSGCKSEVRELAIRPKKIVKESVWADIVTDKGFPKYLASVTIVLEQLLKDRGTITWECYNGGNSWSSLAYFNDEFILVIGESDLRKHSKLRIQLYLHVQWKDYKEGVTDEQRT